MGVEPTCLAAKNRGLQIGELLASLSYPRLPFPPCASKDSPSRREDRLKRHHPLYEGC